MGIKSGTNLKLARLRGIAEGTGRSMRMRCGQQKRRTPHFCGLEAYKRLPWKGKVAETEGFEPSIPVKEYGSLAGNWFQPLTHVSGTPY